MTHNVAVDGITEELSADDGDAAGDVEGHRPLVEQLEREVVNGDLIIGRLVGVTCGHGWTRDTYGMSSQTCVALVLSFSGDPVNIPDLHNITPPMPSTISVALLMRPIVAAMLH